MPFLRAELSHYTAFDSFQRNFTVDLSGLVGSPAAPSAGSFAPPLQSSAADSGAGRFYLVGGAPAPRLAFDPGGHDDLAQSFAGAPQPTPSYLAFAGRDGSFVAVGRGVSSALSFSQAVWGPDSLVAEQSEGLGVANAFLDLAQGGLSSTVGLRPIAGLRVAMQWSATPPPSGLALASPRIRSDASVGAVALTAELRPGWTFGFAYASLKEDNALLGALYAEGSLLDLGARRRSGLMSFSTSIDLGGRRALLAEASFGRTDGATTTGGLIRTVSPLASRAWGVSFVQGGVLRAGDDVTLSVRQPLRVVSGEAQLAVTGVDALGYPVTSFAPVSLAPDGRETDVALGYAAPAGPRMSFRGAVAYRADADNIAGLADVSLRFGFTAAF
jgi:hypothetical protein